MEYAQELLALGVELKDVNDGPSSIFRRARTMGVYLCWKLGEHEVGFWHELVRRLFRPPRLGEFAASAKPEA